MRYRATFSDGTEIERRDLTILAQIPQIEYILKVDEGVNERGYPNDTAVTLINPDGSLRTLELGGFQLLDLGEIYYNGLLREHYVDATFFEQRIGKSFHIPITYATIHMMLNNILPVLKHLVSLGSQAAYEVMLENEKLKLENADLKRKLQG